ncbi:MAG: hypothetical protein ACOYIE_03420 [Agathobaculum sp.]|jgi:hypothetical protein|uniref:hypothetical protein n=1 Tax=Agathobaculum sp. TaxID=2048138 RepID=UPI003D908ABE
MQAEIWYENRSTGTLEWEYDPYGVRITLDCAKPGKEETLLRCYGKTDGFPLLIGLPEPKGERLRLSRHLSRETLKAAGCLHRMPDFFYLSENGAMPAQKENRAADALENKSPAAAYTTGDAVLDRLLSEEEISCRQQDACLELRCTFRPDKPFALAPIFALCSVQKEDAVLRWEKKAQP